jgi:hypothetical protein
VGGAEDRGRGFRGDVRGVVVREGVAP